MVESGWRVSRRVRTVVLVVAACAGRASLGQCPYDWVETPGIAGNPRAFAELDSNEGTHLYMVGGFSKVGELTANGIARWNGSAWSAMGDGLLGDVRAVLTHEVNGSKVIVAGRSSDGAFWWDGQTWKFLGTNASALNVLAMIEHDWDGAGPNPPELFAGGMNTMARFDGTQWELQLGGGMTRTTSTAYVYALASFDNGTGPELIAGGYFDKAGGTAALNMARWDGQSWTALGDGLGKLPPGGGYVSALRVFDQDGPGPLPPQLFAGGDFTQSGSGQPLAAIARWDGKQWQSVGGGLTGKGYAGVWEFATFPTPSGALLVASGTWNTAGSVPANNIAMWNGKTWWPLAEGITPVMSQVGAGVFGVGVYSGPEGPELFAGGDFKFSGLIGAVRLARWAPCGVSCFADANADSVLDIDDFITFQTQHAVGSAAADCTQDAALTIDDFICFQLAFALGC